MRLILTRVLWRFDLELVNDQEDWVSSQRIFSLWEKKPLMVRLHLAQTNPGKGTSMVGEVK